MTDAKKLEKKIALFSEEYTKATMVLNSIMKDLWKYHKKISDAEDKK